VSLKLWVRVASPGTGVTLDEVEFLRAASDRFFDERVMTTFLRSAKAALERGTVGGGVGTEDGVDVLSPSLQAVRKLAEECAAHVLRLGEDCGRDVPFEWFIGAHKPCQFARQSARLEMWRYAISGTVPPPTVCAYDVQTNKALSLFTSTESHVGHAFLNIAVDGARLRLSQSVAQRELDWAGMFTDPTYPGSWEFLCRLGYCSNQPFRVFASVSPSVLFEMLSGIPEAMSEDPVVSTVIERLLDELEDPFFSGDHELKEVVRDNFGTMLAVLRWCLCQTDQGRHKGRTVTLQDSDFQVLTEMGLSVELTDRKTATLFPKIRRLGDDTGMDGFLLCDPGIKNALVRSPLLAELFPRRTVGDAKVVGASGDRVGVAGAGAAAGVVGGGAGAAVPAVDGGALQSEESLSVGATLLEFVLDVPDADLDRGGDDDGSTGLLGAPFVPHVRLLSGGEFLVVDTAAPSRHRASTAYLDTPARWLEQLAAVFGVEVWQAVAESYAMLDASAMVLLATRARTKAVADWVALACLHVATHRLGPAEQKAYIAAIVECGLTRQLKQRSVGTQFLNFFGRLLGQNAFGADSVLSRDTLVEVEARARRMLRAAVHPNLRFKEMALAVVAASSWTLAPMSPVKPLTCLTSADFVCELLFEVFQDSSSHAVSGPAMLAELLGWVPPTSIQFLSRLLRRRMASKALARQPFTNMKLVGLCWAMFPYDDLMPAEDLFAFIRSVVDPPGDVRTSFVSCVTRYPFAVARLATFIAHPERLDPLTYKSFATQVGDNRMVEKVFLIGQETDNWVPYTLRMYKVRLAGRAEVVSGTCADLRNPLHPLVTHLAGVKRLRDLWTRDALSDASNPLRQEDIRDVSKVLELDVSSGVSKDTVARNACCVLYAVLHSSPAGSPRRLANWKEDYVATWRYVLNVATSWLAAFGCTEDDILSLLHAVLGLPYAAGAGNAELVPQYRRAIGDAAGVEAARARVTYIPFQSYIDIRWRDPVTDAMLMFGGSHECLSFTLQVVGAVLPPLTEVTTFPDLVVARPVVDDGAFLLESTSIAEKIAILVRMVRPYTHYLGQVVARIAMHEPRAANHWKSASVRVAELLGPFVSLLHLLMRSVGMAVVCEPTPLQLLATSIRSFADGVRRVTTGVHAAGEVSSLAQGLIHRRVFELVGVSNCKSTHRLHRALLESWVRAPAMKLCRNAFKELWFWEYAECHVCGLVELGLVPRESPHVYVNEGAVVDVVAKISSVVPGECLHVRHVATPSPESAFLWTSFHGPVGAGGAGGAAGPLVAAGVVAGPGDHVADDSGRVDKYLTGGQEPLASFLRERPSAKRSDDDGDDGWVPTSLGVIPPFSPVGLDLPSLVIVAGMLSVHSFDGVCEVKLAGCGSYCLLRVDGMVGVATNTIDSAMHLLCNNALISTVREVLVRDLSLAPGVAEGLIESGRVSFSAAFESPDSVWSYFNSCPDLTLLMPKQGLALRHSGLHSSVWTPYVNSRECFDGRVGVDGVVPVPVNYPRDWVWGKYCFNTADLAKALHCLHVDKNHAPLRKVLDSCAMVAYDHYLDKRAEGEDQVQFARAVFGDVARLPGVTRLCGMHLENNLTAHIQPNPPPHIAQFQLWLHHLRLPIYWRVSRAVGDTTASSLAVLAAVSRRRVTAVDDRLRAIPDSAVVTGVFREGRSDGLGDLLSHAVHSNGSFLAALSAFLTVLQRETAHSDDVLHALQPVGAGDDGAEGALASDLYLDQWTTKLAAVRCVLMAPFMTASRDVVLSGVLSTVSALHDLDWRKDGYDREVFNSLKGRVVLEPGPRTASSVLSRQPGEAICERLETLCGIDVSSIVAVQVACVTGVATCGGLGVCGWFGSRGRGVRHARHPRPALPAVPWVTALLLVALACGLCLWQVCCEEVFADTTGGRPIVFFVHESVFQGTPSQEVKNWLSYVLRSPLCPYLKRAVVQLCQCPGTVFDPLDRVLHRGPLTGVVMAALQPAAHLTDLDQVRSEIGPRAPW
jgi:hypothetical protein